MHGLNFINQFAKIISILSDKGIIWLILGAVLICFKKTRRAGIITIVGVGASFFINSLILKNIFDKARPFVENPEFAFFIDSIGMSIPDSSSFPSGHAFSSFCCAIILTLQLKKKWGLIYILAGSVALSRIFLCVHYPSDVFAGALIGTIVTTLWSLVDYFIKFKSDMNVHE